MNDSGSNDFWDFFSQTSSCGKEIITIESKALNSSLFSIFDKRNHAEFVAVLSQKINDLQAISYESQLNIVDKQKAEKLKYLIQEMINYATALRKVCSGLNEKTMGKPYAHSEYMLDLKQVGMFKDSCGQAQSNLLQ